MLGGAKPPISGQGRGQKGQSPRPKGRERGRVLEASPVPADRGSGAVSSPSEVR